MNSIIMIYIITISLYLLLFYFEHYENNFGMGTIFPEESCIYCWAKKLSKRLKK